MLDGVAIVSMSGDKPPPASSTARIPDVNALPGGLNSNTHQKKMDFQANQEEAEDASSHGLSYTPPIAASVPGTPPEPVDPYPTVAAPAYGTPLAPVAAPVSAAPAVVTRPDMGTSSFNANPMVHPRSADRASRPRPIPCCS